MCFPLSTGMERAFVIRDLRLPSVNFPSSWNKVAMEQQTKIIERLLQHDPSKRPKAVVSRSVRFLVSLRSLAEPSILTLCRTCSRAARFRA